MTRRRWMVVGLLVAVAVGVLVWQLTKAPAGPVGQADALADSVCACEDAACTEALGPKRAALDEVFHSGYVSLSFGDVTAIRGSLDRIRDCEARFVERPPL